MFFTRNVEQFFFNKATFFYFHFIPVSPNLANVRVDFAHHFDFLFKFCIIWVICDLLQKKLRFYLLHSMPHRA